MFIGEYKHSIDDKGRLAVPVKFRSSLTSAAVITRGLDHCLFVYTASEWQQLADKIKAMPFTNANIRAFQRLMLAGAMEVELDSQGRVLIPEYLLEYAGLKKAGLPANRRAVIAGVYNRMEIWDEDAWNAYKTKTESQSDDIAERLGELGI